MVFEQVLSSAASIAAQPGVCTSNLLAGGLASQTAPGPLIDFVDDEVKFVHGQHG